MPKGELGRSALCTRTLNVERKSITGIFPCPGERRCADNAIDERYGGDPLIVRRKFEHSPGISLGGDCLYWRSEDPPPCGAGHISRMGPIGPIG
jgi:hypothetical protein